MAIQHVVCPFCDEEFEEEIEKPSTLDDITQALLRFVGSDSAGDEARIRDKVIEMMEKEFGVSRSIMEGF